MKPVLKAVLCSAAIIGSLLPRTVSAVTVIYDTTGYWTGGVLGFFGPGQGTTFGETFTAPSGGGYVLSDFSFYAQSSGSVASLYLQPFVFEWSGPMTGPGGGATGNALYLGSTFLFSPPSGPGGWTRLTANPDVGLISGFNYVMGFTLSDPANYAASRNNIEFEETPPLTSSVDTGGGAVWLNNGNNFAAINTTTWSTSGDTGDFAFSAQLTTTVPEPATPLLACLAVVLWVIRNRRASMPQIKGESLNRAIEDDLRK